MTDGMRKLLDRLCDHATWAEVSLISDLRFVVDLIKSLAAELEQVWRDQVEDMILTEVLRRENLAALAEAKGKAYFALAKTDNEE